MKLISAKLHAILDYLMAIILMIAGWVIWSTDAPQGAVLVLFISGIATIFYSSLTKYEYSLRKLITFREHLRLDIIQALILGSSPWVFGFADIIYIPHVILALIELWVVAFSFRQESNTINT